MLYSNILYFLMAESTQCSLTVFDLREEER